MASPRRAKNMFRTNTLPFGPSVNRPINKSLVKIVVKEDSFNFRPYMFVPRGSTKYSCLRMTTQKLIWVPPKELIVFVRRCGSFFASNQVRVRIGDGDIQPIKINEAVWG